MCTIKTRKYIRNCPVFLYRARMFVLHLKHDINMYVNLMLHKQSRSKYKPQPKGWASSPEDKPTKREQMRAVIILSAISNKKGGDSKYIQCFMLWLWPLVAL